MADRIYRFDKHQGIEMGWHGKTEVVSDLDLDNNWLRQWDLVPVVMEKRGKPSRWTILECSDLGDALEIGQPYNPQTFRPISNADFLQLVKDSISGAGHTVASVGSVRNRGRVFVSIKLNGMETFVAAGRKFSAYLNFGNGHDKSSVLWANTSNTCTVCDNTFSFNLFAVEAALAAGATVSDDIKVALRHTKNVTMRFPALATLIDKAIGVQGKFQATLNTLAEVQIATPDAQNLFAGFIGRKVAEKDLDKGLSSRSRNTVSRLVELFQSGKGNQGESVADTFGAVTDYYTHESSGGEDTNRQFLSSEYGAGATAKQDFWRGVQDADWRGETQERGERLLVAKSAVAA